MEKPKRRQIKTTKARSMKKTIELLLLEQIKQKISDDEWGKGFYNDEEGE